MTTCSLYITDLDGTLLRSDASLSPFTKAVVNRLVGEGMQFTFATARSPDKALSLLKGLDLRCPAICLNGAVVVDPLSGRWLEDSSIEAEVVSRLIGAGVSGGIAPFLLGENEGRDCLMYLPGGNDFQRLFIEKRAGEPRLKPSSRLSPLDKTLSVTFVGAHSRLERLSEDLHLAFADAVTLRLMRDICHEGGATLELSGRGVDKVHRIEKLCRELGISPSNVTVFGDHLNDLAMFRFAGTSVAVANAVPELKHEATRHCASNDEEGVALYLCEAFDLDIAAIKERSAC